MLSSSIVLAEKVGCADVWRITLAVSWDPSGQCPLEPCYFGMFQGCSFSQKPRLRKRTPALSPVFCANQEKPHVSLLAHVSCGL